MMDVSASYSQGRGRDVCTGASSDPNGKALALVEQDTGTLVIQWGEQQCQASYALGERNKALNYERVDLKCAPQLQEHP
jgi:outer membrane usher protein FimD/PapC